jgi:hypothetical protein
MTSHIDTGIIVGVISIIGAVIACARWTYRQVCSLQDLLEDWHGEEARPGVQGRLGVMERLDRIEKTVNSAAFNSRPNHGTSAYDEHTRLLKEILDRIDNGKDR